MKPTYLSEGGTVGREKGGEREKTVSWPFSEHSGDFNREPAMTDRRIMITGPNRKRTEQSPSPRTKVVLIRKLCFLS